MKIGIVGMGKVGEAVAFGLRRIGHKVLGYDTDRTKIECHYNELYNTTILFICVPTPLVKGKCDTSIVETVVASLLSYQGLIVIKSTVLPGTTWTLTKKYPQLKIAFCPEFLRERARFYDFYENHELCIAGVTHPAHADLIFEAHGDIPKHKVVMTPTEAELAKYFVNCFNAYRINFANAFYDVCKELGADYKTIKDVVMYRADTKSAYMDSNEQFRAFGGACLPKDTKAFESFVSGLSITTELFEKIVSENARVIKESEL
jgi:UDPglucose 6-dehydrogenase